jgi:hypothetical protein
MIFLTAFLSLASNPEGWYAVSRKVTTNFLEIFLVTASLRDVSADEIKHLLDLINDIKQVTEDVYRLAVDSEFLYLSSYETVIRDAGILRMSINRMKVQNNVSRLRRKLPAKGAVAALDRPSDGEDEDEKRGDDKPKGRRAKGG